MKRLGRWLVMGVVTVGSVALAQGAPQSDPMQHDPAHMQGQGGSGTQTTGPMGKMEPKGMGATTGQDMMLGNLPVPQDEQALLNHLHMNNQMEIQMAQLAQQKATSNDVKQFAQMLLTDHQAADQKLQQFAQKRNLTLGDPQAATDVERKKMDKMKSTMAYLQSVEGKPFEQGFLTDQVGAHDGVIAMVMAAQQKFTNPEVQTLLTGMLPSLRQHRDRAYKLLGEQKAPMRQARTPAGR